MITSYKTQNINLCEDVNKLLCQIDVKLGSEAQGKLDGDKYGAKVCVNMQDFKILSRYRQILYQKASNDCCLRGYLIDDIISRIKQLLNRN